MNVIEKLLSVNQYSRSGRRLGAVKGVIFHYTQMAGQRALSTWEFFERGCPAQKHCSSAHYIVDLNGDVYHAVPDQEAAWHCGSEKIDPLSGRVYTDWARKMFGYYAADPATTSPNFCTLGVELCIDGRGNFTPETLLSAEELAGKLLEDHHLPIERLGYHKMVVGWKDCPLEWAVNPALFEVFKGRVQERLGLLL